MAIIPSLQLRETEMPDPLLVVCGRLLLSFEVPQIKYCTLQHSYTEEP
jgi:hypothetical protein